jgi:hypothetical protein
MFEQRKPMMARILQDMKMSSTFRLPGKLGKVSNFKKNKDGTIGIEITGKDMLKAIEKLVADDAWSRRQILAGRNMTKDGPSMSDINEKLFGKKGGISAVVTGELKPLFDYKAEVAAAKEKYPAMLKKLGIASMVSQDEARVEKPSEEKAGEIRILLTWCKPGSKKEYSSSLKRGRLVIKVGDEYIPDYSKLRKHIKSAMKKYKPPAGDPDKTMPVVIEARDMVRWKHIVKVYEAAYKAGVRDITFPVPDMKWPTTRKPKIIRKEANKPAMIKEGKSEGKDSGVSIIHAYGHRWISPSFKKEGGTDETETAVIAALRWLHRHQDADGRWDFNGFTKNCKGEKCGGEGQGDFYDVGVTGLALLAFLGNGHTHRVGAFKETVKRGLQFLKNEQEANGRIGSGRAQVGGESWFYNHAFALYALAEAYAITRDEQIGEMTRKAMRYSLFAQNPGSGWRYEPRGGKSDTSITSLMVMALKAAEKAGLDVPKQSFKDARKWIDSVTKENGRTGYMEKGDHGSCFDTLEKRKVKRVKNETMTAAAIICRIFTGQDKRAPIINKGVDLIMDKPPTLDKPGWKKRFKEKKQIKKYVDFYYWYYGTNAMFQIGGYKWKKWNKTVKKLLLEKQRSGGCADGSWDPDGYWSSFSGRVYSTAINALTLETYYRYERLQK